MRTTILTYLKSLLLCITLLSTPFVFTALDEQFGLLSLSSSLMHRIDEEIKLALAMEPLEQSSKKPFQEIIWEYKNNKLPFILARKVHLLADGSRFYEYYDSNLLEAEQPTADSSTTYKEYFLLHPLDNTWHYLATSLDARNGNQKKLTLIEFAQKLKDTFSSNSQSSDIASLFLMLGICCENGSGIEKDYPLALYYYCLASARGSQEAHISISCLFSPQSMSKRDVAINDRLLEIYKSLHPLSLRSSASSQSYRETIQQLYKALQDAPGTSSNDSLEGYRLKAKQNILSRKIADYHLSQALYQPTPSTINKLLDFAIGLLTSNHGELYLDNDSIANAQQIVDLIESHYKGKLDDTQEEKIDYITTLITSK